MPGNWQDYPDYPFCTRRCRMIDLGRWLGEDYRIAGTPPSDSDRPPSSAEENDDSAR
jgi:endogenous inhibitor of DNA gyrase (YacG/DUF329 family)